MRRSEEKCSHGGVRVYAVFVQEVSLDDANDFVVFVDLADGWGHSECGPVRAFGFQQSSDRRTSAGYYNGGDGSSGTGPGPNLGITFTSDFVTVAQGVF